MALRYLSSLHQQHPSSLYCGYSKQIGFFVLGVDGTNFDENHSWVMKAKFRLSGDIAWQTHSKISSATRRQGSRCWYESVLDRQRKKGRIFAP